MQFTIRTLQNKRYIFDITATITVAEFLAQARKLIDGLEALLDDDNQAFNEKMLMVDVFAELKFNPDIENGLLFLRMDFETGNIGSNVRFSRQGRAGQVKREREEADIDTVKAAMQKISMEDDPVDAVNLTGLSLEMNQPIVRPFFYTPMREEINKPNNNNVSEARLTSPRK